MPSDYAKIIEVTLDRETAWQLIEPIKDDLFSAVADAFEAFRTENRGQLYVLSPSAKATVLNSHVIGKLRERFDGSPSVDVRRSNGLSFLRLREGVGIKVKKVDTSFRSSTYPTAQTKAIRQQEVIEGFDVGEWFELAYMVDETFACVDGVFVLFKVNDAVKWKIELSPSVTVVPGPTPLIPEGTSVVRVKHEHVKNAKKQETAE